MTSAPRWRRFDEWDTRPLRHDQFAVEDPEAGFATFHSPWDPAPSARIEDGRVVEIDGKPEADFDILDAFIAAHHLDLEWSTKPWRWIPPRSLACWSTSTCRARHWSGWRAA